MRRAIEMTPASLRHRRKSHPEGDQHRPIALMASMESRETACTQWDRNLLSVCPHGGGPARWPSLGMSPASKAIRARPEPSLAARSLTSEGPRVLKAGAEVLHVPHRRCRVCALGHPMRHPVTSIEAGRRTCTPSLPGPRAIHTPPTSAPCGVFTPWPAHAVTALDPVHCYMFSIIASPKAEHDSRVAPVIRRSKS